MNVAIIPARGGSKRIPRKNIRLFMGMPMIAYPLRLAAESGLFERIIVSTDDDEIAAVAREYGAETPFVRPSGLADDLTGTDAVVAHALRNLSGTMPDKVCCLYATTPLLRATDLVDAAALLTSDVSMVMAGQPYSTPIQRALRVTAAGGVEPIFPQWIESRSQDLEQAWMDAGQFYWAWPEYYLRPLPAYGEAIRMFRLPRERVQDLDTEDDWRMAEFLYQYNRDRDDAA